MEGRNPSRPPINGGGRLGWEEMWCPSGSSWTRVPPGGRLESDPTDRPGSAHEEATDRRTEGSRLTPTRGVGAGVEVQARRTTARPETVVRLGPRVGGETCDGQTEGGSGGRVDGGRLVGTALGGGGGGRAATTLGDLGGGGQRGRAAALGDLGGGGGRGREAARTCLEEGGGARPSTW